VKNVGASRLWLLGMGASDFPDHNPDRASPALGPGNRANGATKKEVHGLEMWLKW
jgi:hypothetical protein